ncbi:MAG: DUF3836 domain-containing protein [Prevotella sp.]|nr:DUF3836 domain-containing protein [Prevotella sp.]
MEAIITAATVLTMYFNAVNSDNTTQNDRHQMEQKIEYCYTYDEQGRLQDKETLSWDEATKQWTKSSRLTYRYYKNGYNVEMSYWNAEQQQYDLPTEVTLYRSMAPNLTTVKTYKMNEQQDNMFLTSSMVMMEPLDDLRLLADK